MTRTLFALRLDAVVYNNLHRALDLHMELRRPAVLHIRHKHELELEYTRVGIGRFLLQAYYGSRLEMVFDTLPTPYKKEYV